LHNPIRDSMEMKTQRVADDMSDKITDINRKETVYPRTGYEGTKGGVEV
jgi:hypothetical protein